MTATEAAIAAGNAAGPAPAASAPVDTRGMVNASAPAHYTVKRGDTLWGIASMYLKDPWLWPEVWVINPQVANPHLIYPGDQLALAYGADGRPQISLEQAGAVRLDPRLRTSELDGSIPTIPYAAIAAFLGRPAIMTEDEIRPRPTWSPSATMHQVASTDNTAYVRGLPATPAASYAIVHIAGPAARSGRQLGGRLRGHLHRDGAGAARRGSGQDHSSRIRHARRCAATACSRATCRRRR